MISAERKAAKIQFKRGALVSIGFNVSQVGKSIYTHRCTSDETSVMIAVTMESSIGGPAPISKHMGVSRMVHAGNVL